MVPILDAFTSYYDRMKFFTGNTTSTTQMWDSVTLPKDCSLVYIIAAGGGGGGGYGKVAALGTAAVGGGGGGSGAIISTLIPRFMLPDIM